MIFMLRRRIFAALFMLCAAVLAFPSVSEAKNVIVSDAQASGVKYEADGYTEHYHPEIATLRELFAKVVESGDVVYIGENWGGSRLDGNEEEVDETWDNEGWLARFLVTEPIEISKDVEIYASCTSRRLGNDIIEVVNLTKEGDMKEDLTTFEGQGKSQIFRITGGAKVTIANLRIHGAYTGSAEKGGAVAIFEGSQVTIRNCIIKETHSSTFEDGRSYGKGGGVYVNASRLTLQSSDIRNNTAFGTVGGGIALENGAYA
ncbi:MAG: right-handed parallel beta-helix repeat-containing protein, partial [Synergistaceae bacterium]|nr:right-handed parallel beta-helix repeat-containing protein [Synergistaceae bacterium]